MGKRRVIVGTKSGPNFAVDGHDTALVVVVEKTPQVAYEEFVDPRSAKE